MQSEKEVIELTKKVLNLQKEILEVKEHLFEVEKKVQRTEPFKPALMPTDAVYELEKYPY